MKLRDRTAAVRCREIGGADVVLEVDGRPEPVVLQINGGKFAQ
jgi:hypothetical protein